MHWSHPSPTQPVLAMLLFPFLQYTHIFYIYIYIYTHSFLSSTEFTTISVDSFNIPHKYEVKRRPRGIMGHISAANAANAALSVKHHRERKKGRKGRKKVIKTINQTRKFWPEEDEQDGQEEKEEVEKERERERKKRQDFETIDRFVCTKIGPTCVLHRQLFFTPSP